MPTPAPGPRPDMVRVTARRPCPICRHPDWCGIAADGASVVCMRTASDTPAKNGGHVHRLDSPVPVPPPKPAAPAKDWRAEAERYAAALTPARAAKLAGMLGVPVAALKFLPLTGADPENKAFTFAELDGAGRVVGVCRRLLADGKKLMVPGGKRGLAVPDGWRDRPGAVLLAEGASDVLAATAAGLACVGRPSNVGGVDLLVALLRDLPAGRDVVVVGENDRKPDGLWPGRDGATKVARELAARLGRRVGWALPPGGAKDARAWLTDAARGGLPWPDRGCQFYDAMFAGVEWVAPPRTLPAGGTGGPALLTRSMADVAPKPVNWLWAGRVPFGMLTLLDGDPSLGKSTLTADLAARLTCGRPMPGAADPSCPPAGVLFMAAEDSAEHTIRPRLEAAGADLARCHLFDGIDVGGRERPPSLPDDLPFLERLIAEKGVGLLIIDPILGYLSGGIDSNSDQSARAVLHGLKAVAERTGAAVICLRHLNKKAGGSAIYRGGGSIAFTAAARSALLAGKHPDRPDVRVLCTTKCNLAAMPKGIEYVLEDCGGVPRVAWGQESTLTADDLVAAPVARERDPAVSEAAEFLRDELAAGPLRAADVEERADKNGISRAALRRAKQELGVKSRKVGYAAAAWEWTLPGTPKPSDGLPLM